jgi:hypothetical protein
MYTVSSSIYVDKNKKSSSHHIYAIGKEEKNQFPSSHHEIKSPTFHETHASKKMG